MGVFFEASKYNLPRFMGKKGRHNNRSTKTTAKYRFPIGKLATKRKELQELFLENCQNLQEEKRKVDRVSKRVSRALEYAV
mgnify:CR=1 FL=1